MTDDTTPGTALTAALVKAQSEMENAALNKTNPHFHSKFADLAAVRAATLPALTKHGLAMMQTTEANGDGHLWLVTTLRHVGGGAVESRWPITIEKPQSMGSALTYGRRYCWAAMCGIAADEDDDANAAQAGNGAAKAPEQQFAGSRTKTQLGKDIRALHTDILACADADSLTALLEATKQDQKDCADFLPKWWNGDGDSKGLAKTIAEKKTALAAQEADAGTVGEILERHDRDAVA